MCLSPSLEINQKSAYVKVVAEVDRACLQITTQELFFLKPFYVKSQTVSILKFFLQMPVLGIGIILFHKKSES